jgi:6-phosphogluconolactonase
MVLSIVMISGCTSGVAPIPTPGAETMTQPSEPAVFVYVGTYTGKGSHGIYTYQFDPATGDLALLGTTDAENPSFLAISADKRFLYAVNELGSFGGEPTGAVSAFAVDEATGLLTLINQQPSQGRAPAHISVDRAGAWVYVANYTSGTAAVFPVQEGGGLGEVTDVVRHEGSGPDGRRQEGPHAHSITLDPGERRAYVADLGIDRVMIYDVSQTPGKLIPNDPPYAEVEGGSGPRHFAFHPSGRFAYLINEMGNTLSAFAYDPETGGLTLLQTVDTLPEGFDGRNTTADIHVHPTGRYVYGSNRGHDSIVVYAVDREAGTLSYVGHVATGGSTPRNFALDPTGTYLLAANQDSDNVVVFRIDPGSGLPAPTGVQASVSMPVCLKFVVR